MCTSRVCTHDVAAKRQARGGQLSCTMYRYYYALIHELYPISRILVRTSIPNPSLYIETCSCRRLVFCVDSDWPPRGSRDRGSRRTTRGTSVHTTTTSSTSTLYIVLDLVCTCSCDSSTRPQAVTRDNVGQVSNSIAISTLQVIISAAFDRSCTNSKHNTLYTYPHCRSRAAAGAPRDSVVARARTTDGRVPRQLDEQDERRSAGRPAAGLGA